MYGLDLIRENSQFKGSKGSPCNEQGNGEVNVNTLVITVNRKRKCGSCSGTCFELGICDLFKTMSITDCSTGPRSAVGNVSGNRCESDCRSRGREFDPSPVPYFRGD